MTQQYQKHDVSVGWSGVGVAEEREGKLTRRVPKGESESVNRPCMVFSQRKERSSKIVLKANLFICKEYKAHPCCYNATALQSFIEDQPF